MREEELLRIEQGNPQPLGEALMVMGLFLGVVGLLAFIVFGVLV